MAKKGNRVQVILECTEQKDNGVAGMYRLERKKYNPFLKRVTVHREIK